MASQTQQFYHSIQHYERYFDKIYDRINAVERARDAQTGIESEPLRRRKEESGNPRVYNRHVVDPAKQNKAIPTEKNFEVRTLTYLGTFIRHASLYGVHISEAEVELYLKEIQQLFEHCRSERQAAVLFKHYTAELFETLFDKLKSNPEAIKDFPLSFGETEGQVGKKKLQKSFYQENAWMGLEIDAYELHTTFKAGKNEYTIKTIPLLKRTNSLDVYLFGKNKDKTLWKDKTWYKILPKGRQRFCDYYLEKMRRNPNLMLNSGLRGVMPGLKNAYRTELWCENNKIYHSYHSAALPVANESLFHDHPESDMQAYMGVTVDHLRENMSTNDKGKKPYIIYTSLVSSVRDIPSRAVERVKAFLGGSSEELIDRAIYYTASVFAEDSQQLGHFNACMNGVRHLEPYRNLQEIRDLYKKADQYCKDRDNSAPPELKKAVKALKKQLEYARLPRGLDPELAAYDLMDAYNEVICLFEEAEGITSCASGENRTLIEESEKLKRAICRHEKIDYHKNRESASVKAIANTVVNSGHFQQITAGPGGIVGKWGIRQKSMSAVPTSQRAQTKPMQAGSADTKRPYSPIEHQVTPWTRMTGQPVYSVMSFEAFKAANRCQIKIIPNAAKFDKQKAKSGVIYLDKNTRQAYMRCGKGKNDVTKFSISEHKNEKDINNIDNLSTFKCGRWAFKSYMLGLAATAGAVPKQAAIDKYLLTISESILDLMWDQHTKSSVRLKLHHTANTFFNEKLDKLIKAVDSCEAKAFDGTSDKEKINQQYKEKKIRVLTRFKYSLLLHAEEVGMPAKHLNGMIQTLDEKIKALKKIEEASGTYAEKRDREILECCQTFVEGIYDAKKREYKGDSVYQKEFSKFKKECVNRIGSVRVGAGASGSSDHTLHNFPIAVESEKLALIDEFESALAHCAAEQGMPKKYLKEANSLLEEKRQLKLALYEKKKTKKTKGKQAETDAKTSKSDLPIRDIRQKYREEYWKENIKKTGHQATDTFLEHMCRGLLGENGVDEIKSAKDPMQQFESEVQRYLDAVERVATKKKQIQENNSTIGSANSNSLQECAEIDRRYTALKIRTMESLASVLHVAYHRENIDETAKERIEKAQQKVEKIIKDLKEDHRQDVSLSDINRLFTMFSSIGDGGGCCSLFNHGISSDTSTPPHPLSVQVP